MTATEITHEYEEWLRTVIPMPLVEKDLRHKHKKMSKGDDPFPFFRATYPVWLKRWAEHAGDLDDAPRVLTVGDVHLENYGTWRDADGRLCWGVNDFDECDDLPYTMDLVRLATSVRFARDGGHVKVKFAEACRRIADGYREAMTAGGTPFVLEEHHPELRAMAMAADREPTEFWDDMKELLELDPVILPQEVVDVLTVDRPAGLMHGEFRPRPKAGMGSLGRPRYVVLAEWRGGWVCREAKATAPPATAWAFGTPAVCRTKETAEAAVRSHDPFYKQTGGWVVRRLAPRASKIELDALADVNVYTLLHAMGAEVANIHLGGVLAADRILPDLDERPADWLADSARAFADVIEADRQEWLAAQD